MNRVGADAVRQMGITYMSGMSEQVASHFGTIIELRLSQVSGLVGAVPPTRFTDGMPLQIELAYNARSTGFEYLAFYTEDGEFRMIYGSQVTPDVPEAMYRSVQGGRYNVCAGKDANGTPVVLMGIPAVYPMPGGETSIALVAGLPTSYLTDALESNIRSNMVEYFVIRDNGEYVFQNGVVEESTYFEHIEKSYETYEGKTASRYAGELRDALEQNRDYTDEVMIAGERWHIYCTSLPNSEWHLILKMSYDTSAETIRILEEKWNLISFGGGGLIMGVLLLGFAVYFRLMRKQMSALNEARKYAERSNRAKDEFLSNMSHDIRTPMNGIMGMTSIAIDNLNNPSRVRTCLKKINISSHHLLGLINDMLDMAKIESGELVLHMESVCLRELMQNVMTVILPQVQEKKQHFNIYIYDVYHENVWTDRVRLAQILLNILGNAVKFTPEGGSIEIELCEKPSPRGDAYIRSCLHIKDNGIGMSEEFQSRIFDAFAREDNARIDKSAGAGMGMTITKSIVDAMGGEIVVKSQQGKGSDFYISIDMEKEAGQEEKLRLPEKAVLVIDDNQTAAEATVKLLRSLGLRAEYALSMQQAFQMLGTCQDNGNYHMILLDSDMEEKDGIELAGELCRQFGLQEPVILLSDTEDDELEARAEEAGIGGTLARPLFRSGLYSGLRRFVEDEIPQTPQTDTEKVDLAGRHILVAEDNEMNWEIADALLSGLGMELDWAENGQICVEKFRQSAPGFYDAILMDIRMPVMTGFEAAAAIRSLEREDAKSILIIALSADAFSDDVEKCMEYGMNAHTSKPFELDKIVSLLGRYFAEK